MELTVILLAKRLFRRVFPRRKHPLLDQVLSDAPNDVSYARAYDTAVRAAGEAVDDFVNLRYEEGRRWRNVVSHYVNTGSISVLDVGGGNGAIELAFSAEERFQTTSVEMLWNDNVRNLASLAGTSLRRVIADAAMLPFRNHTFDAVTCLEIVEHLAQPEEAVDELRRVMRTGGVLLLTTPARWRYALRGDPHFGIPGLALLPAKYQRFVAARRGFSEPHHHVDRLYGSIGQIAKLFRGFAVAEVLSRSRAPQQWFWDALVLRKR